jgi:hypothetical protein
MAELCDETKFLERSSGQHHMDRRHKLPFYIPTYAACRRDNF